MQNTLIIAETQPLIAEREKNEKWQEYHSESHPEVFTASKIPYLFYEQYKKDWSTKTFFLARHNALRGLPIPKKPQIPSNILEYGEMLEPYMMAEVKKQAEPLGFLAIQPGFLLLPYGSVTMGNTADMLLVNNSEIICVEGKANYFQVGFNPDEPVEKIVKKYYLLQNTLQMGMWNSTRGVITIRRGNTQIYAGVPFSEELFAEIIISAQEFWQDIRAGNFEGRFAKSKPSGWKSQALETLSKAVVISETLEECLSKLEIFCPESKMPGACSVPKKTKLGSWMFHLNNVN